MYLVCPGAAESGKSTVLKQLRLNYGNYSFGDEEKVHHKFIICSNIIQIAYEILLGAQKLNITAKHPDLNEKAVKEFMKIIEDRNSFHFPRDQKEFPFVVSIAKGICSDSETLDAVLAKASDLTLLDSAF